LEEPIAEGPSLGRTVELKPMLAEYYRFRGWDITGIPTPKKLEELGLGGYTC
jgi:aldehyde:ferredoxin oxidoreductase